jgi:CBS domain-containing protein
MSTCPYCEADNIEGVDVCEQCGQSLSDLYLPAPTNVVARSLVKDRIRVLKPKQPVSVSPNTPVRDVLRLLVDKSIGCVIVTEEGKAVGIFSERDALIKLNTQATKLGDHPVSEFMTSHPQTLDAAAKIAFAVKHMDLGGYRHLPITDEDGNLSGIISVRDILRYLTENMTAAKSG